MTGKTLPCRYCRRKSHNEQTGFIEKFENSFEILWISSSDEMKFGGFGNYCLTL